MDLVRDQRNQLKRHGRGRPPYRYVEVGLLTNVTTMLLKRLPAVESDHYPYFTGIIYTAANSGKILS